MNTHLRRSCNEGFYLRIYSQSKLNKLFILDGEGMFLAYSKLKFNQLNCYYYYDSSHLCSMNLFPFLIILLGKFLKFASIIIFIIYSIFYLNVRQLLFNYAKPVLIVFNMFFYYSCYLIYTLPPFINQLFFQEIIKSIYLSNLSAFITNVIFTKIK